MVSLPSVALLLATVVATTATNPTAAASAAGPQAPTGLGVSCDASRCELTLDGVVFSSAPTASVHAEGRWCRSSDGTLEPAGPPQPLSGTDKLGPYTGTALPWTCGGTPFETSVRTYRAAEGDAVIFAQRWPAGAKQTAIGPAVPHADPAVDLGPPSADCALEPGTDFNGGDFARLSAATPEACCALCKQNPRCAVFTHYTGRAHTGARAHCDLKTAVVRKLTNQPNHTAGSCRPPNPSPNPPPSPGPSETPAQQRVLSAFPRLVPPAATGMSYATVYNQMVGGMADGTRYGAWDAAAVVAAGGVPGGTMAGPMMLWTATGSAMVLTPVTQTMEMNMAWDAATATLEAGLLGSVAEIPANYTSETMLFLGNRTRESCQPRACGLNSAVAGWGVALRRYKGKDTGFPAGGFDADPTLAYLGY